MSPGPRGAPLLQQSLERAAKVAECADDDVPVLVGARLVVDFFVDAQFEAGEKGNDVLSLFGAMRGDVVRGVSRFLGLFRVVRHPHVPRGPVQIQLLDQPFGFFFDFVGFGIGLLDDFSNRFLALVEGSKLVRCFFWVRTLACASARDGTGTAFAARFTVRAEVIWETRGACIRPGIVSSIPWHTPTRYVSRAFLRRRIRRAR